MFKVLRDWVQRYFSDEEAVVLAVLLVLAFTAVLTLGGMLAPVLAGMVLAYLMQGLVVALERLRVPAAAAVGLVFALFMGLLLVFIVVVLPLLWHQLITLFNELPGMLAKWQSLLLLLPERYPHLVSDEQVLQAIEVARGEIGKFGQLALTFSLSSLPLLVNIMIYLVLVPILVFFFLKDRALIGRWVRGYLPRERALITRVAQEMNRQIANYIRGKVIEIIICGGVTYIAFVTMGLNYAALLALLVGVSVVVPYVGAVVVTIFAIVVNTPKLTKTTQLREILSSSTRANLQAALRTIRFGARGPRNRAVLYRRNEGDAVSIVGKLFTEVSAADIGDRGCQGKHVVVGSR